MGNAMRIDGALTGVQFDNEGKMTNVEGDIQQVTFENGETISIIGHIKQIMRESKTTASHAFKLETPGKAAELITSVDSPKLYNTDGSERLLEPNQKVTPVYQAKAGF